MKTTDIHTHVLNDYTVPDSGVYFKRWEIPGFFQGTAPEMIEELCDFFDYKPDWLPFLRVWNMDSMEQVQKLQQLAIYAGIERVCALQIWPAMDTPSGLVSALQLLQWHMDTGKPYKGPRPLKIYPPLHGVLTIEQAQYCADNRIPVVAHCSPGGIEGELDAGAHPDLWIPVLEAVPELHLCLAHGGGCAQFLRYCDGRARADNWTAAIVNLMARFDFVYIDTAYHEAAAKEPERYFGFTGSSVSGLEWFMRMYPDRVLFGSDYPLILAEGITYQQYVSAFRSNLTKTEWKWIACDNPAIFLYETEGE